MNNQFVGDIGDYTKLGMLLELERAGFTIGINWYWTPDNPTKTGGIHTDYLDDKRCGKRERDRPDPDLFSFLHDIRIKRTRSQTVDTLLSLFNQNSTVDYRARMDFSVTQQCIRQQREIWHNDALKALSSKDIVFLDPDNALQAKSDPYDAKDGHLYVAYKEAADYYDDKATVIIYNHLPIKSKKQYFINNRLRPIFKHIKISPDNVFCIEAPRRSVRYYLIVAQPNHRDLIQQVLHKMIDLDKPGWRNYLLDVSQLLRYGE